jgi:curved DNA-binding protein CbpA
MPPKAASSVPPRILTPTGALPTTNEMTRRRTIVDRARSVDSEDYFRLLHVDRGATSEEIRDSFFKLAKQWHPDTLTAGLFDLRPDAQRIFVKMTAAYETLMNADRRRDYETQIGARAQDATEADTFFAQAEMEMVLGDVKKAEQLCRRALVTYPGRPEYAALLVWLEALEPPKRTPEFVRSKIAQLDAALAKDAKCRRAAYYRAMLYARLDDHDSAVRDLRRAAEADPDDADAARELRAYENAIRDGAITLKRTTPPPGTVKKHSSGLFERFRRK